MKPCYISANCTIQNKTIFILYLNVKCFCSFNNYIYLINVWDITHGMCDYLTLENYGKQNLFFRSHTHTHTHNRIIRMPRNLMQDILSHYNQIGLRNNKKIPNSKTVINNKWQCVVCSIHLIVFKTN